MRLLFLGLGQPLDVPVGGVRGAVVGSGDACASQQCQGSEAIQDT